VQSGEALLKCAAHTLPLAGHMVSHRVSLLRNGQQNGPLAPAAQYLLEICDSNCSLSKHTQTDSDADSDAHADRLNDLCDFNSSRGSSRVSSPVTVPSIVCGYTDWTAGCVLRVRVGNEDSLHDWQQQIKSAIQASL
jgi:hypothetical protein